MTCLFRPAAARAEVIQFSIIATVRPALDGHSFGPFGTAEKITARNDRRGSNDPRDAVIGDIWLASCDVEGRVEATAEVVNLRPARGGNGTLLLELPNRGRKLMPMLFDDALKAPAQCLEAKTRAGASCYAPKSDVRGPSQAFQT